MTERITEVSRGYQNDIRSINRDLMEKALHMRCLAYLSQAKAGLLTQTLFEMDRSKKALHGTYCRLSEEQAVIRRQKAELEAANRELRSFSYAVSHDLRAPLRAINGFAHALGEDKAAQLDDEARDYLARIVAAAERMGVLIDGMLELGRLSQKEMQRDEIDLSALAEAILRELETGEPGRAVRWTVAPGLRARADRNLAYSLLQNLLGNAWKYTRRRADAEIAFGAARGRRRSRAGILRPRQRRRPRPGAGAQALRALPALPRGARVRRPRHRAGHRQAHPRPPWRPHPGRVGARPGRHLPFRLRRVNKKGRRFRVGP
jgi:signal transduction histidine kinase